ncbi:ATP-binding protein [Microbulbifer magnicolonia]|uniref:ATP-binding protein n=1 Tax=Microbulbifer magnicolonia TaxID=3109744 RepID=UPI002B4082BB|nr:ATP-binding protein [Microbulbifer sp. GG15]
MLIALLSTITLVNFLSALHGYRASMAEAQRLFDRQLAATARLLVDMPVPDEPPLVVAQAEPLVLQVWSAEGEMLLRSADAPLQPISEFESGYREVNFSGYRWRSVTEFFPASSRWVIVAERADLRYQLAEKVILESVMPILLGLPVAGLLIWLLIGWGLSSLRQLAEALQDKRAEDLSPLPLQDPPEELEPVVKSTNALLARLRASFERERRFSADAAHELRTPIAAIQVHAHNLDSELRQYKLAQTPESLGKLQGSIERMAHLVEQMLDLFRTTPEHYPARFETLDLQLLAREALAEQYGAFAAKNQTVELTGTRSSVRGDRFALMILLKNLLNNACKYTPDAGRIEVSTTSADGGTTLRVEDSGPGIPAAEYDRIFERFYRVGGDRHATTAEGCGLGLSIVRHIAQLHRAQVRLGQSRFGHGLAVEVEFPQETAAEGGAGGHHG